MIGIKCERDSYRFFRRYGRRFEESEGKQVFMEFAAEERAHCQLLIREYRVLRERLGLPRSGKRTAARSTN